MVSRSTGYLFVIAMLKNCYEKNRLPYDDDDTTRLEATGPYSRQAESSDLQLQGAPTPCSTHLTKFDYSAQNFSIFCLNMVRRLQRFLTSI